jgi:hypothetical protein
MPWPFRRFKLSPLRVNLSESGLGAGTKGKGYVTGDRDGIYFRQAMLTPGEQGKTPARSTPGLLWSVLIILTGLLWALMILGSL